MTATAAAQKLKYHGFTQIFNRCELDININFQKG
jgi:hypothetical protein